MIAFFRGAMLRRLSSAAVTFAVLSTASGSASASFLSGDALDSMAMGIAWGVVVVVPIALIVLFWKPQGLFPAGS